MWQEVDFRGGPERPACVKSCRPAVVWMRCCWAQTHTHTLMDKILLQWTVAHWHPTCCDTVSQDLNTRRLKKKKKKKLVLQFSCTRCVISSTSENLQPAISGDVAGLICNHRFGFKALNRIPSHLSINFPRELEKYYLHKSYYVNNALEGKQRHCPCPSSIKDGYYKPNESSHLAPVKKKHCYFTNYKTM